MLDAFFERLRSAGVDTNIPHRDGGNADDVDVASDVCLSYASTWGDAGFLLGLAVGIQLGPDAFTSSAQRGFRRPRSGV